MIVELDLTEERIKKVRKKLQPPWAFFEHSEDPSLVVLCLCHGDVRLNLTNEQAIELGEFFNESQIVVGVPK